MAADGPQQVYTKRLEWTGHAHSSVICTGDFDDWKGTQPLQRENGKWVARVQLPYGEKQVKYKFLVDGTWQHATDQQVVNDDAGNTNNVFTIPEGPSDVSTADNDTSAQLESAQTEGESSLATVTSAEEAERDIPKTIQDLFSNTSSGDILGPGIGALNGASPDGNAGGPFQYPGLVTYNMSNFGASKHLGPIQYNYPSKYLLQKRGDEEEDKKEVTPTDVQIACEYILTKYKSVHAQAQNRLSVQKELEEEQKQREKSESEGAEDKKLTQIEEGAASSPPKEGNHTSPTNVSNKTKPKTLPSIQVPGIAKIYSTIKASHPNWVFSEKRLRNIIKEGEDAALVSNSSNEPKESAYLEADRIVKLSGLIGSGKFATDLIPLSKFDAVLQMELDDQWAATNGLPLPSSTSSSTAASTSGSPSKSVSTADHGEVKKNEEPPIAASSSSKSKKKKKAGTPANVVESVVNGLSEGAESVVNKVTASLPASTNANAVASSSSSALGALTAAPTKRNPTNAVGDVALKWYGPVKGRGVVARRKFKQGSVIFREDAFAFAPTKTIQKAINEGTGCSFCGKLFSSKAQSLVVPCIAHDHLPTAQGARKTSSSMKKVPTSASSSLVKNEKEVNNRSQAEQAEDVAKSQKPTCKNKFCNKLCRERATEMYANLLCPLVNPSFAAFIRWAETADPRAMKMNPTGVFYIMLRLIVASAKPSPGATEEAISLMRRIESLAAVNERTRRSRELHMLADMQYGHDWITGYRLVMEALQLPDRYYKPAHPESNATKKEEDGQQDDHGMEKDSSKFFPGATLKRSEFGGINALPDWYRNLTLPEEMEAKLMGMDNYLVWLGRVALNQEDDGGIYMLHPCMNHACNPNAAVRRTANISGVGAREAKPSRIFVMATRDIEEGEEITVMYINTSTHYGMRQSMLKTDYLFECGCSMCQSQLEEQQLAGSKTGNAITADGESSKDEEEQDVIALALKAPPGATVDEAYAARQRSNANGASVNGNTNGHENNEDSNNGGPDSSTGSVKLSAATIKKKKKKAAAKLRQEQEAAEAAAKAHALDPMGFFKNDKPSTPWYEEDDI